MIGIRFLWNIDWNLRGVPDRVTRESRYEALSSFRRIEYSERTIRAVWALKSALFALRKM